MKIDCLADVSIEKHLLMISSEMESAKSTGRMEMATFDAF